MPCLKSAGNVLRRFYRRFYKASSRSSAREIGRLDDRFAPG